jgi:Leucine-rich repeat (LRR) protein
MDTTLQNYLNGLCCSATPPTPLYNFDVESSNWAGVGITNQASFNSVLGVATGAFQITGNKIQAEILTTSSSMLNLINTNILKLNYITFEGIKDLRLDYNLIADFNPIFPLPSSLKSLYLINNQMVSFAPTYPLPPSVQYLSLKNNLITNTGYSNSEAWANNQIPFTSSCEIDLNGNIDSVSGTNLESILLTKNATVLA